MKITSLSILLIAIATFVSCGSDDDNENKNGGNTPNESLVPGNDLQVGESARDLLSNDLFGALVIEVMYHENHAPREGSMENTKNFLEEFLNKPGGIEIKLRQIPSPESGSYSSQEVRNIESEHRTEFNRTDTIAVSLLFLDGEYSTPNVLGIAYQNTSTAVFQSTVKSNSGGLGQPSRELVETTVIEHEIGHILGLVNTGTPMVHDHQDESNGHHCTDDNCLMYYAIESADMISNILGGSIPELDEKCKQDLRANGGK